MDKEKIELRRDEMYSEWKRFWDYWYAKPDLTMREAFTLYLMSKEQNEENKAQ